LRIGASELQQKRRDKSSRFLVTGGTGFLGGHISAQLLKSGYDVLLLARPEKGHSAEERVNRIVDWFGLGPGARRRLQVLPGLIERPSLGLSPGDLAFVLGNVDEIIHCASNTSFTERKRKEVEAANILGMAHVLGLAEESSCSFFHHLSTAYVAGKKTGLCGEELADRGPFHNVYEETKARGERMAWDLCRRAGIRLSIYRPSIVYGDSKTGRSLRFNAVYYPVRVAILLRTLYEADIRDRAGKKAELLGIRLEDDGCLFLPMRVEVSDGAGINLTPIDYFVAAFMALMEDRPEGGIFHLVNPRSKRIEDIIDYAQRLFHLRGIEPSGAQDFDGRPRNALEVLYDSYLEAYAPYMKDRRIFDLSCTLPVLERRGIVCPEFDFDVFSRCMNYAIEVDWGAKLF
jgi:nucleoside-diphosphate-sugar epimerase